MRQRKSVIDIEATLRMRDGSIKHFGRDMTTEEYGIFMTLLAMASLTDSLGCDLAFFTYDETVLRLDAFHEKRRAGRASATLRVFSLHKQIARIATRSWVDVCRAVAATMAQRNLGHCVFTLGDPVGRPDLGFFIIGDDIVTLMEDGPSDIKYFEPAD